MQYRINTTANADTWEQIAEEENEIGIRIFYNGKFINYFFNPVDVQNLGLSAIFDVVDPDPDFINAKKIYKQIEQKPKRKKKTTLKLVS